MLPDNFDTPGIFAEVEDGQAASATPNKRCLLIGIKDPAYPGEINVPYRPTSLEDARAKLGPRSMLFHQYQAAQAQLPFGQGADLFVLPLAEPVGGVKATHTIKFLAEPTLGVLSANVAALDSGVCRIRVGCRGGEFIFAIGETFSQIAAKAKAMLDELPELDVTVGIAGDTLTLTEYLSGEHGNDCPIEVSFLTNGTGVAASPGTLTLAAGPVTAAGTITIRSHAQIRTVLIAAANTDAQSAIAIRNDLNASPFPVSAALASPATGVVTLFYKPGRIAHRLSATAAGITPQTITGALGTLGLGAPSLTAALASLGAEIGSAYKTMAVPFTTATTWTPLFQHLLVEADVIHGKGQTAFAALALPLSDYAATPLVDATTPKLSVSDRPRLLWAKGSPMRSWLVSARIAAAVAATDYQAQNFNFLQLQTTETAPFGVPARADWPDVDEVELASDLGLAPLGVSSVGQPAEINDAGLYKVLHARTTYKPRGTLDQKRKKWSSAHTVDFLNQSLRAWLFALFYDKSTKALGSPRTDRTTTDSGILEAVFAWLRQMYDLDLVNDPEGIKAAIRVTSPSPTKKRVEVPYHIVADLDRIHVVGQYQ